MAPLFWMTAETVLASRLLPRRFRVFPPVFVKVRLPAGMMSAPEPSDSMVEMPPDPAISMMRVTLSPAPT